MQLLYLSDKLRTNLFYTKYVIIRIHTGFVGHSSPLGRFVIVMFSTYKGERVWITLSKIKYYKLWIWNRYVKQGGPTFCNWWANLNFHKNAEGRQKIKKLCYNLFIFYFIIYFMILRFCYNIIVILIFNKKKKLI